MDKKYTREVTMRFLEASDLIQADKSLSKSDYASSVDLRVGNLARIRTSPDNYVSIESLCEMIQRYGVSPVWLLTGHGDMYANSSKIAAKDILKSRIVGMELAIDDIKKSLNILKQNSK